MLKSQHIKINSKGPSSDLSVALDVFLSSLKCEMNGLSQVKGGLYSVIWILFLDSDYTYRPTKTISPVGKGREHAPGLSVCL